jgi:GNAT superfamily N-acetyltransferase
MASYRFCRSDDVALLVGAYNACYRAHFPELPAMREDDFKRAIRELNVWTSSCMVAMAGDEAAGVLLAAKRETENLIHRVGVAPGHLRREHGRHLLDSLSQKLAILGPTRLVAEVPAEMDGACSFMEACGYVEEKVYTDFAHRGGGDRPPSAELVMPVTVDELMANDAIDQEAHRCWKRAPATLINVKESLSGIAVATDERIEAWLLFRDPGAGGAIEILAFECAEPQRRERLLGLLFAQVCSGPDRAIRIDRVDEGEIPFELLESWGFRVGRRTVLFANEAKAT